MGAPLALRPVRSRLNAAFLYTAARLAKGESLPEINTKSSLDRLFDPESSYRKLWDLIQRFAFIQGWSDLSDDDISEQMVLAKHNGFKLDDGTTVKPEHIVEAQMLWNKRGWVSYEKQRAGKGNAVRQFGLPALAVVGACFGVVMPMD